MADIASLGIKVTTDGVQQAADSLDKMASAGDRAAASAAKVTKPTADAARAFQAEADSLAALIGKMDPVSKKLDDIAAAQLRLNALRKNGGISDFGAADLQSQLDRARQAIDKTGEAVHNFSLNNANARRELGLLAKDVATGNWGRFQQSFGTLLGQSGALGLAFSGLGLAVAAIAAPLAGFAIAALKGYQENEKLRTSLIATNDAAGVSAAGLDRMASQVGEVTGKWGDARKAIEDFAASGRVTGAGIGGLAQEAVNMSMVTGESIDKTVAKLIELGEKPAETIAKLNEQYHVLTAAQYARIAALEEEGRVSDAARLANEALSDEMSKRAKEVEDSAGWIVRSAHWVRDAWNEAWDAVKQAGKPTSLADQAKDIEAQIDALKNPKPKIRTDKQGNLVQSNEVLVGATDDDPRVKKLQADLAAIQKQRYDLGLADVNRGLDDQANARGIEAQQRLSRFATPQQKLDDSLKKAAQDRLAALYGVVDPAARARIEAEFGEQVKQARDAYDSAMKKRDGGASNAEETALSNAFKANLASMADAYKNAQAQLDAARKAGTVSDDDYYKQAHDLLWKNEGDQVTAIQAEINRLQTRKAIGAERIKLDGQVTQLQAQAAKLEADAISKDDILASQQKANYEKRQQAIEAYTQALNKANEALERQVNAEIARIGMGEQAYRRQQAINKAYEDQADKMQELALKLQAGTRGEVGGIDQRQYDADVAALQDATDRKVAILKDGYTRMDEAQSNWKNGATAAIEDYGASAADVAGHTRDVFTNAFNGIGDVFANFVKTGKLNFSDLFDSIIADVTRMETRIYASKALQWLQGGQSPSGGMSSDQTASLINGAGSFIDSIITSANGNVFMNSPSLSAYSGTVVDKPTMFAFAKGAGLMGEAGPEAILPLMRGPNGKLGVTVNAPASSNASRAPFTLNQNIHVQGRVDRRTSQQIAQDSARKQRIAQTRNA